MKNTKHLIVAPSLIEDIKTIISNARVNITKKINSELLLTYWQIGKLIVNNEKKNSFNEQTARQVILTLSTQLTRELGKGFSRSNLFNMRKFYIEYKSAQTVSGHLSWSHICELLVIDDKPKRDFYQKETINSNWSFRELKRQVNTSLYERLLLSSGKNNKEKVLALALKGQEIQKPVDIIKEPYVFEFLELPENKPVLEKDLEASLIKNLENFLLELGKGFMFVGSQQRITINNTSYYVDMVFYNKILKCYVLIELKTRKLDIADAGQLNTYLNYYKTEVNEKSDNPPVGIILCADKDEITAEYILSGFENKVFASKYSLVLPQKQKLIEEVKKIMKKK